MEAIEATEISSAQGYKLQPRVIKEESTGLKITLRHLPTRVYHHILSMRGDDDSGHLIQAQLMAAFSIKAIEGMEEPVTFCNEEIDGTEYQRLDNRTVDLFPAGFLTMLNVEISKYNMLTMEEMKKLNFTIA